MKQQNNMNSILFLANCFTSRPMRVAKTESEVRPLYESCSAAVSAASSGGVSPLEGTRGGTPRKLAGVDACATSRGVGASIHPFHRSWFFAAIAGLLALIPPTHASSAAADINAAAAPAVVATHPQSSTALAVEDIRDIRPPFHLPPGWMWMAWVAGGCTVAALGYALWRWRHRIPGLRPKLPYELALEKLEAARRFMQPESAREFSIAVSVVVREYTETRFATYAAHRTTEEFLHDCVSRPDSPLTNYRESLGEFLHHCDLAKFARWVLSGPEMEAMLQSACTFVRETGLTAPTSNKFPAHSTRACSTLHRGGAERTDASDSISPTLKTSPVTPS